MKLSKEIWGKIIEKNRIAFISNKKNIDVLEYEIPTKIKEESNQKGKNTLIDYLCEVDFNQYPKFAEKTFAWVSILFEKGYLNDEIFRDKDFKDFLSNMLMNQSKKKSNSFSNIKDLEKLLPYKKILRKDDFEILLNQWLDSMPNQSQLYWQKIFSDTLIENIIIKIFREIELSQETKNKFHQIKFLKDNNQKIFDVLCGLNIEKNLFKNDEENKMYYSMKVEINYAYLVSYFSNCSESLLKRLIITIFSVYEKAFEDMKIMNIKDDSKQNQKIFITDEKNIFVKNQKIKKTIDDWISQNLDEINKISATILINSLNKQNHNEVQDIQIIVEKLKMQTVLNHELKEKKDKKTNKI